MPEGPVVFTNGIFDILHRAHVGLLKECKQIAGHNGIVCVGINSDESTYQLKGPTRPINNHHDRKYILEALTYVDNVYIFTQDTPYELIKELKPDIIVKGGDYQPHEVVGNDIAKVLIYPYQDGYSTSSIVGEK